MPWAPSDAPAHTHLASSEPRRLMWSKIANDARERFLRLGYRENDADAAAIRVADAVLKRHYGE